MLLYIILLNTKYRKNNIKSTALSKDKVVKNLYYENLKIFGFIT
jgi:hypothetical protein